VDQYDTRIWERCPIKSRIVGTGDLTEVFFDDDCPRTLTCEALGLEISNRSNYPSVNDNSLWPQELSLGERQAIVSKSEKKRVVTQLVPVIMPDTPCYTCTRGNSISTEQSTETIGRRRPRRKNA
jgi:hypothetical protein